MCVTEHRIYSSRRCRRRELSWESYSPTFSRRHYPLTHHPRFGPCHGVSRCQTRQAPMSCRRRANPTRRHRVKTTTNSLFNLPNQRRQRWQKCHRRRRRRRRRRLLVRTLQWWLRIGLTAGWLGHDLTARPSTRRSTAHARSAGNCTYNLWRASSRTFHSSLWVTLVL